VARARRTRDRDRRDRIGLPLSEESAAGWHGAAYEAQAVHHRRLDEWFLDRHRPEAGDLVVDAGCGAGDFTRHLAGLVPAGRVVGVEPDESMLAAARTKQAANLEFRAGTLQELDAVCDPGSADLVVSRAVFHWLPLADYPRAYAAIHRVLRPGGVLRAESGGAGNVARVAEVLDDLAARHGLPPATVSFPDAGTALELLEHVGFDVPEGGVTTVAQRRPFDREALRGFLHTQAALAYVGGAEPGLRAAFLADVDAALDRLRRADGTHDQTFVRLDVLARRP
jgi:ubiquinone/menaquinone biosynthesis C-methylase UbiE